MKIVFEQGEQDMLPSEILFAIEVAFDDAFSPEGNWDWLTPQCEDVAVELLRGRLNLRDLDIYYE